MANDQEKPRRHDEEVEGQSVEEPKPPVSLTHAEVASAKISIDELLTLRLEIAAAKLNKQLTNDVFDVIKRWLWGAALLLGLATLGGAFTLNDLLKNRIDSAVEGKQAEIERARTQVMDLLADVRTTSRGASKELEQLRVELDSAKQTLSEIKAQASKEGDEAMKQVREVVLLVKRGSADALSSQGASNAIPTTQTYPAWLRNLPTGTVLLASADFAETGLATARGSVFTNALIPAASTAESDVNRDGMVSVQEMFNSAKRAVEQVRKGFPQHPIIINSGANLDLFKLNGEGKKSSLRVSRLHLISVGISDYGNPSASLPGSAEDADKFVRLFTDSGAASGGVIKSNYALRDSNATMKAVRSAISSVEEKSTSKDTLVFYFSGHGYMDKSSPDPANDKRIIFHNYTDGGAKVKEVIDWLLKVPAANRVVVLDY